MTLPSFELCWQELHREQKTLESSSLKALFSENPERFEDLSFEVGDILFDFSKQHITKSTVEKLCHLAQSCQLIERRADLFSGKALNLTENRPVLHTLLRDLSANELWHQGENLSSKVQHECEKMQHFAQSIHQRQRLGVTGKPFTDVLCLGIGGSELGPALVSESLKKDIHLLQPHFISNVDGNALERRLASLNPETTLCIISSKTFTTPETLENALAVKEWYQQQPCINSSTAHLIAVTANVKQAKAFGILAQNIFEFWEWVGGRYSIWSAVSLPVILSCGFETFQQFLEGAFDMDRHFLDAPLRQNIPVLLALIGIWNTNFWGYPTHAILPYEDALRLLPAYLQQLEMESNGKSVTRNNQICEHSTAPILFGGLGCDGQHAYMQLLHQGKHIVPVDFLIPAKSSSSYADHHKLLLASCLSQSKALMEGKSEDLLYKSCPGNRPSTTIMYAQLTPKVLGSLLALYEHKVFVQGIIWGINSFDQWGVELGKTLTKTLLPILNAETLAKSAYESLDASTAGLIRFYHRKKGNSDLV